MVLLGILGVSPLGFPHSCFKVLCVFRLVSVFLSFQSLFVAVVFGCFCEVFMLVFILFSVYYKILISPLLVL